VIEDGAVSFVDLALIYGWTSMEADRPDEDEFSMGLDPQTRGMRWPFSGIESGSNQTSSDLKSGLFRKLITQGFA
jgi:hypothetical protein